jgi:enamine deaminase RidA (YjgF/YER057c/UK114 family)
MRTRRQSFLQHCGIIGSARMQFETGAKSCDIFLLTGATNIMINVIEAKGRQAAYFGVPWEDNYGYPQAIRVGDTIYVSGQISHDEQGNFIAPAELDATGKPSNFSAMEDQMRAAYANAAKLLDSLGSAMDHVVEETLFVVDMDSAFAVAGSVRKDAYGTDQPLCASNIIGTSRLALPQYLIEIAFKAIVPQS